MIHNTRWLGTVFPRLFTSLPSIVGVVNDGRFAVALHKYTYVGYFNDNLNFFSTTSVASSERTYQINITNQPNQRSEQFIGFFKPSSSGLTTISVTSDDACYIWMGNSVYSPTTSNAFIKCPGIHNVNTLNARASAEVLLDSNLYYPIRIYYGNSTVVGSFTMSVAMPGLPMTYSIPDNIYNNTYLLNI